MRRVWLRAATECPGTLDVAVFFLDDGVIAGTQQAVRWFCRALEAEFSSLGLDFNPEKCVVTPSAGDRCNFGPDAFPGWVWNLSRNVKVLGAAVGDAAYCEALVRKRRSNASKLQDRIGELGDSQAGLLLLRSCASFAKLLYNARTSPVCLHSAELIGYDEDVRRAFSHLTRLSPDDVTWKRAQWSTGVGGLGLRSISSHAHAAFASSVVGTAQLQCAIWKSLSVADVLAEPAVQISFQELDAILPESLSAALHSGTGVHQKSLSKALDNAARETTMQDPSLASDLRAHLSLVSAVGADAWLHALPCKTECTHVDPELFRIALARRLRLPLLQKPAPCNACGSALDVFMDHALVCQCGGNRTLRHNAIRDVTFDFAVNAGVRAEKEKAGLLPPRPGTDDLASQMPTSGRRPADIWLPTWPDGKPAAVDFAVSSGLRADLLSAAAHDASSVCVQYEDVKRKYLDTANSCHNAGLAFVPFVVEAHGGGLGPAARKVCGHLVKAAAARDGDEAEVHAADLFRRISITLQRENARAVLRRLPQAAPPPPAAYPEVWAEAT
jgi:hypothetical protein